MAVGGATQQDYQKWLEYQQWLDEQQAADELQALDDMVQDLQEQAIEDSLQEVDSVDEPDSSPDVELPEDLTDLDVSSEEDLGIDIELDTLTSLDEFLDWENIWDDLPADDFQDLQEYDHDSELIPELEEPEVITETILDQFEEELFVELSILVSPLSTEKIVEEIEEQEEVDTSADIEELDEQHDLEELEDVDDLEKLDDFEELEDLETSEDLESLEDQDESTELIDHEDLDELEDLEELEEVDNFETLDDIQELEDHEVLKDIEVEESPDEYYDYDFEESESEVDFNDEIEEALDSRDVEDNFDDSFNDYLEFRADLHLLEAQLQADWIQTSETTVSSDPESLPAPQPFGISLDELPFSSPSLDEDDDFLTSLEEQLIDLEDLHTQWYDSSEELLSPDLQQLLLELEENIDLVWEAPTLPDPPPYDFLEDLESHESHEDQIVAQQMSNPLYPYSYRGRTRRPFRRIKEKSDEISPTGTPTSDSKKLKVPTTRGVVKEQIEALSTLESLHHETIGSTRIITLEAGSREAMGEELLAKMGHFTYESDVREYGKRNLVKLTKEANWKPMSAFIKYHRVQKEVYNPSLNKTDYVVHNKKKGWEYTGIQRLKVEVDMPLFEAYKTQLNIQAQSLAADAEPTRVYLSAIARKSDQARDSVEYQDALKFWTQYGYQPYQPTHVYLTQQQNWTVTHVAVSGVDILQDTIKTNRFDNHTLGEIAKVWEEQHPSEVEASVINLQVEGSDLTLNEILPPKLVDELQKHSTDLNSLDENKGGTTVFQLQLEKIQDDLQDVLESPLSKYLGLHPDTIKDVDFETSWGDTRSEKTVGVDKEGQELRYTFGPDIVVFDPNDKVIAVIQLKGRTQHQYSPTATSSSFQIIELVKYHVEHEVPVALVNINLVDNGLRYEWLVIGKANSRPTPLMRRLVAPDTDLDPIIPRNARSRAFVESLFEKIRSYEGSFDLKKELNEFQKVVNNSQFKFQKLRFYKSIHKSLDVEKYWNQLVRKAEEQGLSSKNIHDFNKFYQKWKKMVVDDYIEKLEDLE